MVLSALRLALVGKQILNVVLLQSAGRRAGGPHGQGGRQFLPLLVLVHLEAQKCVCERRRELFFSCDCLRRPEDFSTAGCSYLLQRAIIPSRH